MKTQTIFTAFFLGLVLSSNAQSTEPAQNKNLNSKSTAVSIATDATPNQQTKAADGDIDKWRGTDKPKPKKTATNGGTDNSANPEPAKADIHRSRSNIKQQ